MFGGPSTGGTPYHAWHQPTLAPPGFAPYGASGGDHSSQQQQQQYTFQSPVAPTASSTWSSQTGAGFTPEEGYANFHQSMGAEPADDENEGPGETDSQ